MKSAHITELNPVPYYDPTKQPTYEIPIPPIVAGTARVVLAVPQNCKAAEMHRIDANSVSVGTRAHDAKRKYPNFISQSAPVTCMTIENGRVTHMKVELPSSAFNKPLQ